jgi:hypothetical protein
MSRVEILVARVSAQGAVPRAIAAVRVAVVPVAAVAVRGEVVQVVAVKVADAMIAAEEDVRRMRCLSRP